MRMNWLPGVAVVLSVGFLLWSCSRSYPLMPEINPGQASAGGSGNFPSDAQSPNRAVLGFWNVHVSADRQTIAAVPDRSIELHLNTVRLLEEKACKDCLKLGNMYVTSGDVLYVDVTLVHPFPGILKYTGFDVRGILMTGSDYAFPGCGRTISWAGDRIRMLSPDGYTTLFNPTEYPVDQPGWPALRYIPGHFAPGGDLSATLNPFVAYKVSEDRRMFEPGESDTRTLYIQLVPGPLEFGYAVDACWTPIQGAIDDPLTDFPLTANCREPYRIFASQGVGLKPVAGSSAPIQVRLWDHQGVDTISTVSMEAPDLFNGVVELAVSTLGDGEALYMGTIENAKGALSGEYPVLVRAIDFDQDENLGQIDAWQVASVKVTKSGYPLNELVYIPAGSFFMGSDPANDPYWAGYCSPGHMHPTDAYCIGKYEVTWREFEPFVASGGYENPAWWSEAGWTWKVDFGVTVPRGDQVLWGHYLIGNIIGSWPALVNYYEAEAFCNWAGGRLPTEAEWERAARGDNDHRLFPWGDQWDPAKCANKDNPDFDWSDAYFPVGTFSPQGDSPWELSDCAGNVSEWTCDWWAMHIYDQYAAGNFAPPPPPAPEEIWRKTGRGGSYGNHPADFRCASRGPATVRGYPTSGGMGFRIVYDAN